MVENNSLSERERERERERELYISTATPDCHAILLGYRADFHDQQPTNMKRPYSSVNVCVCVCHCSSFSLPLDLVLDFMILQSLSFPHDMREEK